MRHKGRSLDTLTLLGELECFFCIKEQNILSATYLICRQIDVNINPGVCKKTHSESSQTGLKILIYKIIEAVRRLQ